LDDLTDGCHGIAVRARPYRVGGGAQPNRDGAHERGFVTAPTIAYYTARARGGVGLVTVEMASPEGCGRHRRRELGISMTTSCPGLRG
jgi:2,4-dienoyl-CoA reductase-like NADH-dependent reductase (Old Yellow Enzyme family)